MVAKSENNIMENITEGWELQTYDTFLQELEAGNYEKARTMIASVKGMGYEGLATIMYNQMMKEPVLTFAKAALWTTFERERKQALVDGLARSKEIYWLRLARKTDEWSASVRCLICGVWWMWSVPKNLDFICPNHN